MTNRTECHFFWYWPNFFFASQYQKRSKAGFEYLCIHLFFDQTVSDLKLISDCIRVSKVLVRLLDDIFEIFEILLIFENTGLFF